jgi:hypothetical protein
LSASSSRFCNSPILFLMVAIDALALRSILASYGEPQQRDGFLRRSGVHRIVSRHLRRPDVRRSSRSS